MGCTQNHALGRNLKLFVVNETTAGTFVKPSGTAQTNYYCVPNLSTSMAQEQERKVRADTRVTRSALERITGKGSAPWSVDSYVIPSGTAGTPPTAHLLYQAAMGSYANVGGTSDTYSLSASQACKTMTMTRESGSVFSESIWGAWCESMTIAAAGGDEPKVSWEGGAMGHVLTGTALLDGLMSSSAAMVVDDFNRYSFGVNSVVQIDADTNSSAGYQVTASDYATFTHTLETTLSADDDDPVIPFVPTWTVAGSPITNIVGSLALTTGQDVSGSSDEFTLPITNFDVTVANNLKVMDDESFQQFPTDVIPVWREVTGNISVRLRKDHLVVLQNRLDYTQGNAITVTMGSVAGSICTVSLPTVELDWAAIDVPEAEEAVMSLPFTAIATSSGEDEMTVAFT